MTDSEKLDKVLAELQEVKQELATVKANQPMFIDNAEASVTITASNQSNPCPSCGAFQFASIDPNAVVLQPYIHIEPPTTFNSDCKVSAP